MFPNLERQTFSGDSHWEHQTSALGVRGSTFQLLHKRSWLKPVPMYPWDSRSTNLMPPSRPQPGDHGQYIMGLANWYRWYMMWTTFKKIIPALTPNSIKESNAAARHGSWQAYGPEHPGQKKNMRDTSVETSGRQAQNHAGQSTEWETSVGDKWETNVKACGPQSGKKNKRGRQVWRQVLNHAALAVQSGRQVGDKWETSGRQEWNHAAPSGQSGKQVWETGGRQV